MQAVKLKSLVNALGADSAAILLPDEAKKYLYCAHSFNMPPEWVSITNGFDEQVPGGSAEVFRTGSLAVKNHIKKWLHGHYIESFMIVPIKQQGRTIAVLELIHGSSGRVFSQADLAAVEEFVKKLSF